MKKKLLVALVALAVTPLAAFAAPPAPFNGLAKVWTQGRSTAGQGAEIVAFDSVNNNLWIAGITGVDIRNAATGSFVDRIAIGNFGSINSVAIHNGVAAFAIESATKTNQGVVRFYNTTTRTQTGLDVTVGALPDMLTFTPNGSKLLVANEGTPSAYGALLSTTNGTKVFGAAAKDPIGSVSIIDMSTRSVVATPNFENPALRSGSNIRLNTGMNFEPEYIAVNKAGTKAYVSLQEANAMGVIDLTTGTTTKVIGLGAKDFSLPGNQIDTRNNGTATFVSTATAAAATAANPTVKGLYMPDGITAFERNGQTFIAMANEGDYREDDGDRSNASAFGAAGDLAGLRVSNTDSTRGSLFIAGARSFSIRDENGNIVYDSGDILDKQAAARGIYDDGRSVQKGVEPEGIEIMDIGNRTYAFIGLERTTKGAFAIFDITDPAHSSFVDMIATDGDLAPEGLTGFVMNGKHYLALANESTEPKFSTTTVYELAPVPEPETYAMLLAGLGLVGLAARRRRLAV
jgi:DNA-binding beta-propeller fold protein YncE